MSKSNVIRAWRDEEYRRSLSNEQRALLPEHPAGVIELADEELDVAGGSFVPLGTFVFCHTMYLGDEYVCGLF